MTDKPCVPVDVEIPDGYKIIAYRIPRPGEMYIQPVNDKRVVCSHPNEVLTDGRLCSKGAIHSSHDWGVSTWVVEPAYEEVTLQTTVKLPKNVVSHYGSFYPPYDCGADEDKEFRKFIEDATFRKV